MRKRPSCAGASVSETGPASRPRIVVAGAGSIGCYFGGHLAAQGFPVTLLGRARILSDISANGLTLTDLDGHEVQVPSASLTLTEDPGCLAAAGIVLVAVKTGATADMARTIAAHAPADAAVISLQNGVGNGATLAAELPGRDVRAGMVPFNVVPLGPGRFHKATEGDTLIAAGGSGRPDLARMLSGPHLQLREVPDLVPVQWGKLVLNLNNALCALSGLALRDQLMHSGWRRLLAEQVSEALRVFRAAGIRPVSPVAAPLAALPLVLRLPTPVFRRVAARMLAVDPEARTSMSYDLMQGRPTEIGALQGEITSLAARHSVPVPLTRAVVAAIHAAEAAGRGCPGISPRAVRRWPPD